MFAALSADKKFLIVSVVNATDSEQTFDLNVSGTRIAGPSTLWQLTGSTLDAADRVGQPPQVEIKEIPIGSAPEHDFGRPHQREHLSLPGGPCSGVRLGAFAAPARLIRSCLKET